MPDRTVLGRIDVRATEHGVAPLLQIRRMRQFDQQIQGLARHPMLGVVDVQIRYPHGELPPTRWIVGEELTKMPIRETRMMVVQFPPGRRRGDVAAHVRRGYNHPRLRAGNTG